MTSVMRKSVVTLMMAIFVAVPLFFVATGAAHADDDDKDKATYSFYKLSSSLTSFLSNQNSPDHQDDDDDGLEQGGWIKSAQGNSTFGFLKQPSNGGSMLGYADPDFSLSLSWLTSELSGSSDSISYSSLVNRNDAGERTTQFDGLQEYAYFGAANADLGLDNTSSGMTSGFVHMIGGGIVLMLYAVAAAVPLLFGAAIAILKLVNPFRWFYLAMSAISSTWANGMTGGQGAPDAFSGLAHWINTWFSTLMDISWMVIVPVFIGVFVLGLFLFKGMNKGSALKKLIVRIVFIGVGLPLLGSGYTATLNAMSDAVGDGNNGATRAVMSTYVDFGNWAMKDRLRIPDGASISWDGKAEHAMPESTIRVRDTAMRINKQAHPDAYAQIHLPSVQGSDPYDSWEKGSMHSNDDTNQGGSSAFAATKGILYRYMTSNAVAASDFESAAKKSLTAYTDKGDADQVKKWFYKDKDTEDLGRSKDDNDDFIDPAKNPVIATAQGSGLSATSAMAHHGQGTQSDSYVFTSAPKTRNCGAKVTDAQGNPMPCNLSPLATYNYLNTKFSASSMVMYSSNKATSGFTRDTHSSISMVGTGPISFMYWVNCVVLLLAVALLGIFYAFGMAFGAIKRTLGSISSIPFALLGSISSIAKVIIYVVAMVIEVIGTIFLYAFVSQMLTSLPQVLEGPLAAALKKSTLLNSGFGVLGTIVVVLLTLFSIIMIMGFTIVAMRARKSFLNAMNEGVTRVVEKFLDVQAAPPKPHGGASAGMASGVGTGLGMAAAGKLAGSGPMGKVTSQKPAGGPGGKPAPGRGGLKGLTAGPGSRPDRQIGPGPGGSDGDAPGSPGGSGDPSNPNGPSDGSGGNGGGQGPSGRPGDQVVPGTVISSTSESGGRGGSSTQRNVQSDRQTAERLRQQGGLTRVPADGQGHPVPSVGQNGSSGQRGRGGQAQGRRRTSSDGQSQPGRQGSPDGQNRRRLRPDRGTVVAAGAGALRGARGGLAGMAGGAVGGAVGHQLGQGGGGSGGRGSRGGGGNDRGGNSGASGRRPSQSSQPAPPSPSSQPRQAGPRQDGGSPPVPRRELPIRQDSAGRSAPRQPARRPRSRRGLRRDDTSPRS